MLVRSLLLALAFLLAGCASSGFKAQPSQVGAIRNVALVAFSVPAHVAEQTGSGPLAGLTSMVAFGKQLASKETPKGNGREVARDAVAGFIEEMSRQANLSFLTMDQVVANPQFKALRETYDQSRAGQGTGKAPVPGLPVIVLTRSAERSEFAAQAARALGVDGVIAVDVNQLYYFLYTGAMGSGEAKAKGAALFKMFDKSGNPVWESPAVVFTEASALMVGGALDPKGAPVLHKSIGTTVAVDLLKTYRDLAK